MIFKMIFSHCAFYSLRLFVAMVFCKQHQNISILFQDDLWMEMCRQKMKMTPLDYINADCQGYLQKLDGHSKSWKKRFCILSDACLYLYVDKESESALGKV